MRKPSCRYDEIRIRITLYLSHVGISDVVPEEQQYAMNRRFSKIFVPATIHKLSRVIRIVRSRVWERRRPATLRRGFPTFTMPSLAPLPSPAASPWFIVHLSCFTLLEQQSPLTRQITGRENEERSRSFDRPRRHFLKSVRDGARRSWRNRRCIYLSAMWKKPWVPHEVLYLSCKP